LIGRYLGQGSFGRRLVTRAIVVLGAVFVGGQVMRTLPHDQTLIFPVGSSFPNATRFSASWQQVSNRPGHSEPSGGVTLDFEDPPPLQIREHASLPNGDYIVTIVIEEASRKHGKSTKAESDQEMRVVSSGMKTSTERRVSLAGGETMIALPASTSLYE
jgi:hypothetical protein